jgi:hypothetical protein
MYLVWLLLLLSVALHGVVLAMPGLDLGSACEVRVEADWSPAAESLNPKNLTRRSIYLETICL